MLKFIKIKSNRNISAHIDDVIIHNYPSEVTLCPYTNNFYNTNNKNVYCVKF